MRVGCGTRDLDIPASKIWSISARSKLLIKLCSKINTINRWSQSVAKLQLGLWWGSNLQSTNSFFQDTNLGLRSTNSQGLQSCSIMRLQPLWYTLVCCCTLFSFHCFCCPLCFYCFHYLILRLYHTPTTTTILCFLLLFICSMSLSLHFLFLTGSLTSLLRRLFGFLSDFNHPSKATTRVFYQPSEATNRAL